jgi:hypothetical protein
MKGEMRWFNEERGDGVIESDDGMRFTVLTSDFLVAPPIGRCAGLPVVFKGDGTRAAEVAVPLAAADPRRARLRSHRSGRSSH